MAEKIGSVLCSICKKEVTTPAVVYKGDGYEKHAHLSCYADSPQDETKVCKECGGKIGDGVRCFHHHPLAPVPCTRLTALLDGEYKVTWISDDEVYLTPLDVDPAPPRKP